MSLLRQGMYKAIFCATLASVLGASPTCLPLPRQKNERLGHDSITKGARKGGGGKGIERTSGLIGGKLPSRS